jgi:hypothetical protein
MGAGVYVGFTSTRGHLVWHPHPFIVIKAGGASADCQHWGLSVSDLSLSFDERGPSGAFMVFVDSDQEVKASQGRPTDAKSAPHFDQVSRHFPADLIV